ncbi:MAG: WcaI family glycosyltransferase, partial [Nitrosospira sp.]|nr:WcaI family glycosyltransferase [Nitrosospira sp.]
DLQVDAAFRLGLLKSGLFGRLLYRIEAYLLRRATRVSTITPAMQARIIDKGMPSEWVWLCPNWADISAIRPSAKHNSFRLGLGVGDDALLVLYAGNMGEKQGLEMVLEAASKCRNDPRLLFLMVGDGGARRRLADLSKKMELQNVRFLPLQPKERLNDMLSAGDIHLVVQKRDAADLVMPSKLTNILAAGRACIATADPGTALHDVVSGYEAGCVVPPGDTDALADAVVKLACDPAMRQFCGRNAREYAEMNLDKDRILSGYAKQLKSLCN